ncbi:hypothetical protein [Mesotoga sp.]|uniref:hypothetical protein n=1 Tax=Mesotoga sp. TaxID=2053577 RepID=UPI00345EF5BF
MGNLAEEYGYRESCNLDICITIADGKEAWVFGNSDVGPLGSTGEGPELYGRLRVPDEHISAVNYSMIGEIDPDKRDLSRSRGRLHISDNYLT